MISFLKKFFGKKQEEGLGTIERRREPRYRAADDFVIEFRNRKMAKPLVGGGRDISANGVRFASKLKMRKGDHLETTLVFSNKYKGKRKVKVDAKIVHAYKPRGASRYRVGCRVLHAEESRSMVRDFLNWIETRFA